MGVQRRNMGDCATDLEKTIMPLAVGGGIYDWSGTQASHVYAENGVAMSKPEIDALVKGWWDGASDGWSSDKEYNELAKDYKPTLGGDEYVCLGRQAFGDGDCMHILRCNVRVVSEVEARLVGGRGGRGRLPARDVNRVEVLGHLRDLHRVEGSVRVGRVAIAGLVGQEPEELLAHLVRRVRDGQRATLAHDLLGRVRAHEPLEARRREPLLDAVDLLPERGILLLLIRRDHGVLVGDKSQMLPM